MLPLFIDMNEVGSWTGLITVLRVGGGQLDAGH